MSLPCGGLWGGSFIGEAGYFVGDLAGGAVGAGRYRMRPRRKPAVCQSGGGGGGRFRR